MPLEHLLDQTLFFDGNKFSPIAVLQSAYKTAINALETVDPKHMGNAQSYLEATIMLINYLEPSRFNKDQIQKALTLFDRNPGEAPFDDTKTYLPFVQTEGERRFAKILLNHLIATKKEIKLLDISAYININIFKWFIKKGLQNELRELVTVLQDRLNQYEKAQCSISESPDLPPTAPVLCFQPFSKKCSAPKKRGAHQHDYVFSPRPSPEMNRLEKPTGPS